MAFDVSALANYTKENEALLVTSSVLGSKTASLIKSQGNVMVGVKSAETINIMDTDAIFQAGGSCGFNASGSTTFTQRTVTVNCKNYKAVLFFQNGVETTVITQQLGMKRRFKG